VKILVHSGAKTALACGGPCGSSDLGKMTKSANATAFAIRDKCSYPEYDHPTQDNEGCLIFFGFKGQSMAVCNRKPAGAPDRKG
jgi:hypothetical protein